LAEGAGSMEIRAEGKYEINDFRLALKLHQPLLYNSRWFFYFMFLLLSVGLVFELWRGETKLEFYSLIPLLIFGGFPYLTINLPLKRIMENPNIHGLIKFQFTGENLTMITPESHNVVKWGAITKQKSNKQIILLYPSSYMYYVAPRRFFASDQYFEAAKQMAKDAIKKPPIVSSP
jgi:hypothetical protein